MRWACWVIGLLVVVEVVIGQSPSPSPVEFNPLLPSVFDFTILHTADVFGNSLPVDQTFLKAACPPEVYNSGEVECIGGVARRKTYIDKVRRKVGTDKVVLTDAGGFFQGSTFYTLFKGAAQAEYMTTLGYNFTGLSSREFFDGVENLEEFFEATNFLGTIYNMDVSNEPLLIDYITNVIILNIDGTDVAFVCNVRTNLASTTDLGPNITVSERSRALAAAIEELNDVNIKIIVLIAGDLGTIEEIQALLFLNPNIDLMILRELDPDVYPILLESPTGWPVPVLGTGEYGEKIGRVDLEFDRLGRLNSVDGQLVVLDSSIDMDPDVEASVAARQRVVEEEFGEVIARTKDEVDGTRESCRFEECTMGVLVTEGVFDWVENESEGPPDVVFINGGGIRASFEEGDITNGDVFQAFPFSNSIVRMKVRGSIFKPVLENSVSFAADGDLQEGTTGRFLQMKGLQFTWNPNLRAQERNDEGEVTFIGERVLDIELENGESINDDAIYDVAVQSFIANGGDGYEWFEDSEFVVSSLVGGPVISSVIIDWLPSVSPYEPFLRGNIDENPNAQPFDPFAAQRPSDGMTIAMQILASIAIAISIVYLIITLIYRREKAMLSATPPFLYLIILGTIMMLTTVYLLSPDPTPGLCISWIWLLSLGFTLSFGSLLIKNYRVAKILGNTRQFFKKKIQLNRLFAMLFVVFLLDCVFLILFTVIDMPSVRHNECKYEDAAQIMIIILIAYKAVLVLPACWISWQTQAIENSNFNESKHINWAVYNASIVGVILIPIIATTDEVDSQYIILCCGIIFGSLFTESFLMLPKCVAAIRGLEVADSFSPVGGTSNESIRTGGHSSSSSSKV
mmetsp:Transcript_33213/g.51923  ORF Transcript_33213/g.51923 Transcript_33213/m.51923 type:complete len:854 (-) Transcript_33213:105-2666(-)